MLMRHMIFIWKWCLSLCHGVGKKKASNGIAAAGVFIFLILVIRKTVLTYAFLCPTDCVGDQPDF